MQVTLKVYDADTLDLLGVSEISKASVLKRGDTFHLKLGTSVMLTKFKVVNSGYGEYVGNCEHTGVNVVKVREV